MTTKVHCILDKSRTVDYLATPVRVNRRRLRELGYHVSWFHQLSPKSLAADILCLVSKPVFKLLDERQVILRPDSPTVRLLERARRYASKIVWLDCSDSTGMTHFELLPYVDLYLKNQLLEDKTLYQKTFYGGRIFSDYYHREFGVVDEEPLDRLHPLHDEDFSKVQLSWNMALGEVYHAFTRWSRLRRLAPDLIPPRLDLPYVEPRRPRRLDLFLRASANWNRQSVVFHRRELVRLLESLTEDHPDIASSLRGALGLREYRRQMRDAKLAFGPFGWGELNVREYEALVMGCLLLRPDLSHMTTFPDIFRDNETCVFYSWDFSDLEEKILNCLENDPLREEIARAGQAEYRHCLSQEGMEEFCMWFVRQIER